MSAIVRSQLVVSRDATGPHLILRTMSHVGGGQTLRAPLMLSLARLRPPTPHADTRPTSLELWVWPTGACIKAFAVYL